MLLLLNIDYGAVKKTFKLNRFLAKSLSFKTYEIYLNAISTHVVLKLCKNKNLRC